MFFKRFEFLSQTYAKLVIGVDYGCHFFPIYNDYCGLYTLAYKSSTVSYPNRCHVLQSLKTLISVAENSAAHRTSDPVIYLEMPTYSYFTTVVI